MQIKSISVVGLFGKSGVRSYTLNPDLNILTGRNGSGKTTAMKLAWFVMSGNILNALREISFKSFTIETTEYTCTVIRLGDVQCKVEMEIDGDRYVIEDEEDPDNPFADAAEDKANAILVTRGSSIFFPTFRRIEGGFTMSSSGPSRTRASARGESEIDEALSSLSRKLSNHEHLFVSAISTQDVITLLLKRYASFSEEVNSYQEKVSRSVIQKIRQYENTQSAQQAADALLSETRAEIEKIEEFRSKTMQPLDAMRALVEKLFNHSGISFGKRLNFGDAAAAVNSDVLSAGEKQMLSFICYNAFYKNAVIFIDEPELSLHVDWQRQLYQILQSQGSENQFIFATHSPFIYAKYPDKEVAIGWDKGE
ncbi:AAA family ATPase [Pseudomonas monsensis]